MGGKVTQAGSGAVIANATIAPTARTARADDENDATGAFCSRDDERNLRIQVTAIG